MKNILYFWLLIAMGSCQINSQKETIGYKINGKITGATDSLKVIISNVYFMDSTIVKDGEFSFSGKTDTPRKILLTIEMLLNVTVFGWKTPK
ncbi:DUF4369 domain-containing protein [Costertonia aggregata]|uniref:DUF4369 domain-containing protein n=1 Tax=Costertonia aggregata TaxID=343403 RepID=A0A7H9AT59_9FLAO|nr:DUF4369 domain-containing protein [Costertonia aggregata]QLG46616.1 DUF4369 domain-containing protein [Costertonia aggregata]